MSLRNQMPIRDLDDVKRLEQVPLEQRIPYRSLYDLFASLAKDHPDRLAVRFLQTGEPGSPRDDWSHARFFEGITKAANAFASLGVGRQDVVAFLLPPHPLAHLVLWGAQIAGTVAPVNPLLQPQVIVSMLASAQAKILVIPARSIAPAFWDQIDLIRAKVPTLETIISVGGDQDGVQNVRAFEALLASTPGDRLNIAQMPTRHTVGALFHTGGTTGAPKFARITHWGQLAAAFGNAQIYGLTENDRFLNGLPLFHMGGCVSVGLSFIGSGGANIIPTMTTFRNPVVLANYWKLTAEHEITIVGAIPTTAAAILDAPSDGLDLSKVRFCFTGGSALPLAVAKALEKKLKVPVRQGYAMTESSGALALDPRGWKDPSSVGVRIPYSDVAVVTPGQPVTDANRKRSGESGEIVIRGPNMFAGYTDPKRNEGVLENGWLRTGDLGHMDADNWLYVTGRAKDLIIRGGHNIDPAIIEEVAAQHPAVESSAAVGRLDTHAGEVPALFVKLRQGMTADVNAINAFVAERVAEGPARPRAVTILKDLPLTAVGKIFKPELRRLAAIDACTMILDGLGVTTSDRALSVESSDSGKLKITLQLQGSAANPDTLDKVRREFGRLQADTLLNGVPVADNAAPPAAGEKRGFWSRLFGGA